MDAPQGRPRVLFVTGRLAEPSLRRVLEGLAPRAAIEPMVAVLPISVAALMTPKWAARHLAIPEGVDRVILPGHCRGDLAPVAERSGGTPIEVGPEDLRDLPRHFGLEGPGRDADYGAYDIQVLAEINHAPRLSLAEALEAAERFRAEGADIIDVGCDPGGPWTGVGELVKALRNAGHRVSIDSFDATEVESAVRAGAELVLSVNGTNRDRASDWGVEVVATPDRVGTIDGLDATLELLANQNVPFRVDPILEPIGFGFAASLGRYLEARSRWPEAELMMGVGNLTELTDCDSGGINVLLAGFCQEVGVRSVLTTAVINWARSSVRELDLARRLVHHAVTKRALPKHVEPGLVVLRDPKVPRHGRAALEELQRRVKDPNWRLFAEDDRLYALNATGLFDGTGPFELFGRMDVTDPSHAFYLGYELAKAKTALTLGKAYRQDQALNWGHLTEPEASHRDRHKRSSEAPD